MTGFRCSEIGRWWLAAANRHHDRYRKVDGQWMFPEKGMEARGHFRRSTSGADTHQPVGVGALGNKP